MCFYREVRLKWSSEIGRILHHVDLHIWPGEVLVLVSLVALWPGALWGGRQTQLGQFGLLLLQALFAPLDASILEPNFDLRRRKKSGWLEEAWGWGGGGGVTVLRIGHLSLCELQRGGEQEPLRADHVLLPGELLLQAGELLAGEAGAHPFGLPTLGFEWLQACVDFGHRSCREDGAWLNSSTNISILKTKENPLVPCA